ncbi:MAG: LysM peptidoglycan-binding domain-containing M23 family metallopeptidase [Candidatus Kaelpia aquatica]|nr:LysM peptidoglycan-binding domain-containing M23 family metallopeptidase [Candidatus Kaelpia aquatica]
MKMIIFLAMLLLWGCRSTNSRSSIEYLPASKVYAEPSWSKAKGLYHKVRSGETLYKICSSYEVELKDLIAANNLDDPSRIKEGQLLYIPSRAVKQSLSSSDFIWPVKGKVISYFKDSTSSGINKGIDIKLSSSQRVIAAASGEVCYSGEDIKGYDKVVMIDHGGGLYSLYAYNDVLLVKKGDYVKQGDSISRVDKENGVLHFEVRRENNPLDPLKFLK